MKACMFLLSIALLLFLLTSCAGNSDARDTRIEHRKNRNQQRLKAIEPLRPDDEYRILLR